MSKDGRHLRGAVLGLIALVTWLWRGTPNPGVRVIAASVLGAAVFGAVTFAMAVPYRQVLRATFPVMLVALLAATAVGWEGTAHIKLVPVPAVPAGVSATAEPQFFIPSDDFVDFRYMFWSVGTFPRIGNGYSGFVPGTLSELRRATMTFPDRTSVAKLREYGFRTVILDPSRAVGTPWQDAERKPLAGLGITRTAPGDMVFFDLGPPQPP